MMIFNDAERATVIPLYHYLAPSFSATLTLEYADGESYDVNFLAESESGDFESDPIDEYHVLDFVIKTIRHDGPHRHNTYITVSYKSFPTAIVDQDTNEIVYDATRTPAWLSR